MNAQKITNKYQTQGRAITKGLQKHLPLDSGGVGIINLYTQLEAMQHKWIKKLIENKSIATRIPNAAINIMNIEPRDLLHAAEWEIKTVSHHLEKNFKLKFWATIILNIIELRKDMNTYIGQDNIYIEVTSEINKKNIA